MLLGYFTSLCLHKVYFKILYFQWLSLTGFVKFLGRTGMVRFDVDADHVIMLYIYHVQAYAKWNLRPKDGLSSTLIGTLKPSKGKRWVGNHPN